jgi:hypothetical protein
VGIDCLVRLGTPNIAGTNIAGLLGPLSGNTTDFVDGTNHCRNLGTAIPISANAGNLLRKGSDNLIFAPQGYQGVDTTNSVNYAITVDSSFKLVAGVSVYASFYLANTSISPTLNVNGTGAIQLTNRTSIALSNNEINPGTFHIVYDGTNWRILNSLTRYYSVTDPGTPTINCLGFDEVIVYAYGQNANNIGITLNNVGLNVTITFGVYNGQSSGQYFYWLNIGGGGSFYFPITSMAGIGPVRFDSSTTQSLTAPGYGFFTRGSFMQNIGWVFK